MSRYLGIDLGTSSVKVAVVEESGQVRGRASADYPTRRDGPGHASQSATDWDDSLARAIAHLPEDALSDLAGIAVDGHVPSLVPVDADGMPLHDCLTWQDNRAHAEAARLTAAIGDPIPHIGVPLPWSPSQLPAKAAWFAGQHERDRVAALLSPKDVLNHHLTGELATDSWTSKGLVNVRTSLPATTILAAAGWSDDIIATVLRPWDQLGAVTPAAARRYGLPSGVPVACGWTDAMASFLGVGALDEPSAAVLSGTSEIVGRSMPTESAVQGLYLVPDTVAPLPLAYGPTQSSGAALLWIARALNLSVEHALEAASAASDSFPIFLPYLDGERAPLWDRAVRGAFVGLDSHHGPGELVRGVLTGVGLSARHILDLSGHLRSTLVTVGGRAAAHPAWLTARGTALGSTLAASEEPALTAYGMARLAAWMVTGVLPASSMVLTTHEHTPSSTQVDRGSELFNVYMSAAAAAQEWGEP